MIGLIREVVYRTERLICPLAGVEHICQERALHLEDGLFCCVIITIAMPMTVLTACCKFDEGIELSVALGRPVTLLPLEIIFDVGARRWPPKDHAAVLLTSKQGRDAVLDC
jgi:hypothetical protein